MTKHYYFKDKMLKTEIGSGLFILKYDKATTHKLIEGSKHQKEVVYISPFIKTEGKLIFNLFDEYRYPLGKHEISLKLINPAELKETPPVFSWYVLKDHVVNIIREPGLVLVEYDDYGNKKLGADRVYNFGRGNVDKGKYATPLMTNDKDDWLVYHIFSEDKWPLDTGGIILHKNEIVKVNY